MQMNLRDEARDFNKNLRQVQKNVLNGFETHKNKEKEENLPSYTWWILCSLLQYIYICMYV